jgi:DNA-binding CsgD family transcriptional regulator/PAS domain-containing protein
MNTITSDRLSSLVGAIYGCAIEPDRWPEVMGEICLALGCTTSVMLLADLKDSRHRFFKEWNNDPDWLAKLPQYNDDMTLLYRHAQPSSDHTIDEPLVLSRDVPRKVWASTRYYQEWVRPQGICDSLQAIVLRNATRIGVFAANRHESRGVATDSEVLLLRLLAPHIRRAITINDMMDLKILEAQALSATLDNFSVGVIIVAEDHRILHANDAAREMFAAGSPVCSVNGRLSVHGSDGACELDKAIAFAEQSETTIGAAGTGVALGRNGEPAIAQVLPLASGDLHRQLMPQATATVLVTHEGLRSPAAVKALSANFKLTPAETRMFEQLATGATVAEAAETLAIAKTTARTHLSRILSKTGVTRQTDLVALIHRLSPPVKRRS